MKMTLYPLLKTSAGRIPAEAPAAVVTLERGATTVECDEGALKEKLGEIFSCPVTARLPLGEGGESFSWEERELPPHTEAFFREMVYHLRRYELYGVLEDVR